ncbi:FAD/NAD(P)-binding domain-protein [Diplogelasinospora grovesii]|uniref:FAD/NAD(P)-binding domain-protein n=1 Tax=Diplogelasinospora grovesii TaxID=303347 RepID=A0AAN6N1F6_9PEZI|nr:FAD/NAD(P)-binding domain-protein [Diplogelasinospora grovesii]
MTSTTPPKRPFGRILIVGTGPSGLILAILLAQHGIRSLVLEAWPHLDTRLRATQYGVPATRIFRRAGILEDIRAQSIGSAAFGSICWRRVADQKKLVTLDLSCVADHPDRMTIIPLGDLVQIMYRHCVERYSGLINVKFEHRVVDVRQDSGKAWVNAEVGKEKTRQCFEADYVIGCDGARSTVRKSLFGSHWPGVTFEQQIIVQNIWYDGFEKHGWTGGNYMVDPDTWGLIARRGLGGLWRITYGDDGGLSDDEYLARRPKRLEKMLPGNPTPEQYRIEATNIYKMHNRCVEKMRVGRVLLAADAAHVNNPWGGYGCMSAVLDAGGLADCLIGYYEGRADEDILDTYAEVRREKFIKYVDSRSTRNLERVSKSDPWTVLETDKFFAILRGLEGNKQKTREFMLVSANRRDHDWIANDN